MPFESVFKASGTPSPTRDFWFVWFLLPPAALSVLLLTQTEPRDPLLLTFSVITLLSLPTLGWLLTRGQYRLNRYRRLAKKLVRTKRAKQQQESRAMRILEHIVNPEDTVIPGTNVQQTPLYGFSGDLAIVCRSDDGRVYALLADLTGHGITAAMGATPVASIFKATAKRGMTIEAIAEELNNRLRKLLPSGFFCCAAILVVDRENGTLEACNAGLPELLVARSDGKIAEIIPSSQLPLGIQEFNADEVSISRRRYTSGHQVYAFTDGLIECPGPQPDLFNLSALSTAIASKHYEDSRLPHIWAERQHLTQEIQADDDITIVEVAVC